MKRKLIQRQKRVENFTFTLKAVDEKQHIIEGVFSTGSVDRHGEAVVQNGWDLSNYKTNPVVLWAHQNHEFPIAQMTEIGMDAQGNLAGKMKFAVEEYETAATAYRLMVGKYLRAFSVGFSNNRYEVQQGEDVVNLTENELLEVSVVNVPANAEALSKAKADGIDVSSLEENEEEDTENIEEKILGELSEETLERLSEKICAKLKESTRVDKAIEPKKVETPKAKGGKYLSKRKINKAIRELLKQKK